MNAFGNFSDNFKVSRISKTVGNMLNLRVARKALVPALAGGVLTGVAIYKMLEGTNLTEGRTLLTGYIAGGISLSLDDVLPDMGSFDEAGSILISGTAAGFIVNAALGKGLTADTNGDGTLSDSEKLASYDVQFTPITNAQRLYASVVSGLGVALAAYAEIARSYNV